MNWFDILYWIVIIIAIVIRMMADSRYTYINGEYMNIADDSLNDVRRLYEDRLKIYYKHNKPRLYLVNNNCEARLIPDKNSKKTFFYCKERTDGKNKGRYFEIKGDIEHVNTMWAVFDMEFNDLSSYYDLRKLYYDLNQGIDTRGGLKYFNEDKGNKLPQPQINKSAQNEYCRMEIKTLSNGEKILECSEIWGKKDLVQGFVMSAPPRRFIIKADKLVLYGILSEFSKEKDKMVDYLKLLYRYSSRPECLIQEIEVQEEKNTNTVKEAEPVKYIHVEFGEKQQATKKESNIIKNDIKEHAEEEHKIEKYDERNIDI